MTHFDPKFGLGTLVTHLGEGQDPMHAHVMPIYQTSTYSFENVDTGAGIFKGEVPGYVYSRLNNPNTVHLAERLAMLEGIDLLRAQPERKPQEVVGGMVFGSGMAAITSAILAKVKGGDTIIAQPSLYGATYNFLAEVAPLYGINVVWVVEKDLNSWQAAFEAHPDAVLAYAESPANPVMALVDLAAISDMAHKNGTWVMVDNTFASPYCQRPLTLGADVVVYSTTKYHSGHGQVVGGAVISRHVEYIQKDLYKMLKIMGGVAGPFDAWLVSNGLRTFDLRMQRHCENALTVARFLEDRAEVARVDYPGLESFPQHELAKRQMLHYGGMISFELKDGLAAGKVMLDNVHLMTLAVSLGNLDTLIQHPASMTHASVPQAARLETGITDGLVRLSVGVENVDDLLEDLEHSLKATRKK